MFEGGNFYECCKPHWIRNINNNSFRTLIIARNTAGVYVTDDPTTDFFHCTDTFSTSLKTSSLWNKSPAFSIIPLGLAENKKRFTSC